MQNLHSLHNVYPEMKFTSLFLCILLNSPVFYSKLSAQIIDHTSTFKDIKDPSYFRFQYDNDFFTKEDIYYSQGVSFEFVHPRLKKWPLANLLVKQSHSDNKYGISFNIFGFTPTSILSSDILYGDRPYAAVLDLKLFSISTNYEKKKRVSSSIIMGVIGPAALGEEIQTNIHDWLHNPLPKGWHTQIGNDLVLNYQINYEKQLVSTPGNFLVNGVGEIRAGSLEDKISTGLNLMAGNFNDPYLNSVKKKFTYCFYIQERIQFVGYDASMQGGIFNKRSPYVVPKRDIARINFQADAGISASYKKLYLSYSQSIITKEFATGKFHRWGGFNIGLAL